MSKAFEVYSKLFQLFNEKLLNVLIESRHNPRIHSLNSQAIKQLMYPASVQ